MSASYGDGSSFVKAASSLVVVAVKCRGWSTALSLNTMFSPISASREAGSAESR